MDKSSHNGQFDEFDKLAVERKMSPVHKENKVSHKWLIAFIAVLVCAPILGIGIGYAMSLVHTGNTPVASQSVTPEKSADSENAKEKEKDKAAQKDASDSQEKNESGKDESATDSADAQGNDVRLDTAVSVLNGAGIQGFAAQNAKKLEDQGFTAVTTGDYASDDPQQSTVYYRDASLKATAEKVGELLGIGSVTEDPTSATNEEPIKVVLRS